MEANKSRTKKDDGGDVDSGDSSRPTLQKFSRLTSCTESPHPAFPKSPVFP